MTTEGSVEELERRRLRTFELFGKGDTPTQLAEAMGVTRQTAQLWKGLIAEGGKKALKAIPQHVAMCRMTEDQQAELLEIVEKGVLASGSETQTFGPPSVLLKSS